MTDIYRPLRVITSDQDRWLAARAARNARIDKLGVDRSRFTHAPKIVWSVEAERYEPRFAAIRAEVTLAERMAAWRGLFQATLE